MNRKAVFVVLGLLAGGVIISLVVDRRDRSATG